MHHLNETLNEKAMKAYVWAWADGDGNYINQAESLREILEEILEYYFDEDESFNVEEVDGKFLFQVTLDQQVVDYQIDCETNALREFLNEIADRVDRPDKFDILSTSN